MSKPGQGSHLAKHTAPRAKLVIRSRGGYRFEFPLAADITTIGRGRDCDLILDDDYASRHHARIEVKRDSHVLIDDESRNGTMVAGEKIEKPWPLSPGDEVTIGNTILVYAAETADDSTTAELRSLTPTQAKSAVRVDMDTWEVWIDGRKLQRKLSVLEFKLLGILYSNLDKVCSRDTLCTELWGKDAYTYDMLHQLVHRLKRRVEPDPLNPVYVLSIPGVGYRLQGATPTTEDEP